MHTHPAGVRVLYRDGAVADGRSATIQRNISILVEDWRIAWIRPTSGEHDHGEAPVRDCAGATSSLPGLALEAGPLRLSPAPGAAAATLVAPRA